MTFCRTRDILHGRDGLLGVVVLAVDEGAVGLPPLDPLGVDGDLFALDLSDLAGLMAVEVAEENLDYVVLADGHGPEEICIVYKASLSL